MTNIELLPFNPNIFENQFSHDNFMACFQPLEAAWNREIPSYAFNNSVHRFNILYS
ncbi:MAG: hypothetical protein ACJ751_10680 [Niastella sp.]|uniref:hypothetical protein n=1 Tax=Niastella sp. TaxID=1869183 RepID=UPI00389A90E3